MKLHLPSGLRAAILACFAVVSPVAVPAISASMAGGVVVATFTCALSPALAESVVWDANWNAADAPSEIPDANVLAELPSGFTFLSASGSAYMADGQTIVRLAGTAADATEVSVVAGAGATAADPSASSEGPITVDTWLKVTGGSYTTLVGGSYAQNYAGGQPADFTGDSHILLTSESGSAATATVDYIVGGNYMDAQSAAFTGNSYISVESGAVNGSIVGAGTSAHTRTAVFNGNSGIWVYTPLSSTAEPRFDLPGNLIVGGCASVANFAPKLQQTGDSRVEVDLSAYTPAEGAGAPAMEKIIIGGAWLSSGTTSTHTGSSAVSLSGTTAAGGNASFDLPVVAGAYFAGNGSSTQSADTSLSVSGGSFSQALVGGSYLASESATGVSSTIGGNTSVTLGGALELSGSEARVVGGSYVNAASANVQSGAHSVTLNEGNYAGDVLGGSFITAGSGTVTQTTGDIQLAINGGSVSGTVYGGSYSQRNNAESVSSHGAIAITLAGGALLGDVYAAGGLAQEVEAPEAVLSSVTATSTQVELAEGVVLGQADSPIIISGGVQNSNAASGVSGARTLLLSGTSGYANLDNVTFYNFNVVENASAATIRLQEASADFTKRGSGTLTIIGAASNLNPIAELTVEAGELNTGTAWLTYGNAGLTSITVGAGASLVTDGLVLADGAALALDVTTASAPLVSVGSAGGLSVGGQKTLSLTLTGVDTLAAGADATLISWGNASAPFALSDVTWVNKGAGMDDYELSIDGNALVLKHAADLVWNGAAEGTWSADDGDWSGQSGAASTDKSVAFDTPVGSTAAVNISGEVAPLSISVNNAEGSTYTFAADAAGGSIGGAASLTKNNGGTLVMNLANTYTGGTTLNGGTLEAAAAGALGTGAVSVNGGELLVSAADAVAGNALVLGNGTLSYAADETRDLNTAAVSQVAGTSPEIEVASGSTVAWQYSDAAALQAAVGSELSLSGGGTLSLEAADPATEAALGGALSLADEGTTLVLASAGMKQLGSADAPMAVALGAGTTLRVEQPQADADSLLSTSLTGEGTLELANSNADANSALRLAGDNSAFAGSVNLGSADAAPAATGTTPAVILDYSEGSPVGGADASLNLNGLSFATTLAEGGVTRTAAALNLNRDTTQYAMVAGLENVFSGALTGAAGSRWLLDATPVSGGQTNTLTGELAGFSGTLAATGSEGSVARWLLGGEGAAANPTLAASLAADNAWNEFVVDYAEETTLSGAVTGQANLTQQGAGTLVLTGASDSQGTLSVAEGSTVQLGSADAAGQWGNAAGSTLAGAGTLSLVNGTLAGPLSLAVGASPQVLVNAAAGCTVDMGGNEGSLITGSVSLAEGASLTQVGSGILDRELNFTLATANIGNGSAAAAMVQFVEDTLLRAARAVTASLGSTTADINLDTSAAGVVELLRQHRAAGTESYLTLTNGQLVTAADYSNVNFGPNMDILSTLGLSIARVEGGALVLEGVAEGVYIAGEGEDPTEVAGYSSLGTYQAVAVMAGETLTLSLDGAPDLAAGAGATVNNLLGAEDSAFVINNTDTSGEVAVVVLNNTLQAIDPIPGGLPGDPTGANTTFGGSIAGQGGDVELVKTGSGTLSVGGPVTVYQVTAQEGTLALNDGDNEMERLALDGGTVQLNNGTTAGTLEDSDNGGVLSLAENATLTTSGTSTLEESVISGPGMLEITGELTLAQDARLDGAALNLDGGTLSLDATTGHSTAALNGDGVLNGLGTTESVGLAIVGTGGSFSGSLSGNGTLTVAADGSQTFENGFSGGEGWNLTNNGVMGLDFVREDGSNAPLTLGVLTLGEDSITYLEMNTDAPVAGLLTLGSVAVEQGAALTLAPTGAEDIVKEDTSYVIGSVSDGQPAGVLASLAPDTENTVFMLLDSELSNLSVDAEGNLVLNLVMSDENSLAPLANNPNSAAGAGLLWNAARYGNTDMGTDIRALLDALNSGELTAGAANRTLAAAAGAGTAVLSSAMAADVDRQLRAIRNRTTTMGGKSRVCCNKGALASDEPRFGAWINGEGDHSKLHSDGYLPGYSLSSWGGTIGMDVSWDGRYTAGLALTALYGDLDAHSADNATGDFDRYYLSAFARMSCQRWQHTFVGTVGRLDGDLDRTVNYGAGRYRTHGDTEGWGYGFLYEIGYNIPLAEDARFTLQPVVNVSWRHIDIDSYSERGSDAALRVDGRGYNVATFGAGVRTSAKMGESLFNRSGLFEARALVKVDAGDREGEARVAMMGGGGSWGRVHSAKRGAVGVELGAGISVPLGDDDGFIFIDGSAELRNEYSNLNGTLGYRFEF